VSDAAGGIGTRTLRGMFWAYGSYVGGRALVLVSTAILARLLGPEEFGLVAFALAVTAMLDVFADLGVSQALIVTRDLRDKAHTAWTLSVLFGTGSMLVTFALSPLAGAFFREDEVAPLLAVLGVNFLLRSLGATHYALAQRDIDFRKRTAAELADVLVRAGVGIAAALAGAGAWALVLGYLAGTLAMTVTLWTIVSFRPRPRIVRAHSSTLLRFGGGLAVLDVLSVIIANVDYLVIGRVLGQTPLGLYTLGFRLPELLIVNMSVVAGQVLFPAFANIGKGRLADPFLTSIRYTVMVSLPLTIGLAMLAGPIIQVAFGDRWDGAVEAMRILAVFAFAITVGIPAGTAYKSLGRVDVLIKLAVPRCAAAVIAVVLVAGQGIEAVAAAQAAVAGTFAVIGILLAARLLETGLTPILRSLWPSVVAGAGLAGALAATDALVSGALLTLLVAAPVGALAYGATLWVVAPSAVRRLWHMARPPAPAAAVEGDPQ
jgi:PST family polysaccharide transporter